MTTTLKPAVGTHTAVTTSGSSVSNNAGALGANAIANQTNLDDGGSFVLNVGFGSAPAIGTVIALYMIPQTDASNYLDYDSASSPPTANPNYYVGSFVVVKNATPTQRLGLDVPFGTLKALQYECYLVNTTAQTMSPGWTLDFYGQQLQSV